MSNHKRARRRQPSAKPRRSGAFVATPGAGGLTRVAVELGSLPTPTDSIETDAWWVRHRPGTGAVDFLFDTQGDLKKPKVRLCVRMGYEPFLSFAQTLTADGFRRPFDGYVADHPWAAGLGAQEPAPDEDCGDFALLRALAARLAQAGSVVELAFYATSVFELATILREGGSADLRPLVGVTGGINCLVRFLPACERVASEVAAIMRAGRTEASDANAE